MKIDQLIAKTNKLMVSHILDSRDKKLCLEHKEWIPLSNDEKKQISVENRIACTIYRNLYHKWEFSEKAYYISDKYYQNEILSRLNSINYNRFGMCHKNSIFSDKNYQDSFMKEMKFPDTIIRAIAGEFYDNNNNHITKEEACKLINQHERLVFKKSIGTGHGRGVAVYNKELFAKAFDEYDTDYIVQKIVTQHEFLGGYNQSSVNVIRITSLYWRGEVYILGAILRVGAPGAFCDHMGNDGNAPRIIAIDGSGNLSGPAIDPDNGYNYQHVYGKRIEGSIPCFERMKEIIGVEHRKYPHHKVIGWDLTVNRDNEVICIEYNSAVPGLSQTQMALGPVFAQKSVRGIALLDEIKEAFGLE